MHRHPGALEREVADIAALADHVAHPATDAYRGLRGPLWHTLRALGFRGGDVLVQGDGARTLLAMREHPDTTIDFVSARLTNLHQARPFEPPRPAITGGDGDYDAVIASLPWSDVQMRDTYRRARHNARQALLAVNATRLAKPGGLVAILAGHDLMDSPDPTPRHAFRSHATFLGAVRLPAGALRPSAGTDNVVDLLLLAAVDRGSTGGGSLRLSPTVEIPVSGHTLRINQYYDDHPDQILGTIDAEANVWGQHTLTVAETPGNLRHQVHEALTRLTDTALHHRLVPAPDATHATENDAGTHDTWVVESARRHLPDLLRIDQPTSSAGSDPQHPSAGPAAPDVDL